MNDLIIVAVIAAFPPTLAVLVALRKQKKAHEETKGELAGIHVLVNSRLTTALEEITALRDFIDSRTRKGETSEDFVPASALPTSAMVAKRKEQARTIGQPGTGQTRPSGKPFTKKDVAKARKAKKVNPDEGNR